MIAAAYPIERGGVDEVAVTVDQRTIALAVERDLGMAVEVTAHELQGLAVHCRPVAAVQAIGGRFRGHGRIRCGRRDRTDFLKLGSLLRAANRHFLGEDIGLAGVVRGRAAGERRQPVVHRIADQQVARTER